MSFSPLWRKLVLLVHVVTSVGFIGAAAGFLALAIVGATTAEPRLVATAYVAMQILTWDVVVPLAVAALLVGIVSSLGTPWGLFRFWWVIVKLVLTIIALVVLLIQTRTIDGLAAASATLGPGGLMEARAAMILHASGGLVVLIAATVLSIYKPRGMTRYGARKLA